MKRKTRNKIILILAIIIILFTGMLVYASVLLESEYIYDGVYVQDIDLSGKTKDTAKIVLDEKFKFGKLTLTNGEKQWSENLSNLGFRYNTDKAVAQAYSVGRSSGFLENAIKVLSMKLGKEDHIDLEIIEDYKKLEPFYKQVESEIDKSVKNATIDASMGNISIVAGHDGYKVDTKKLQEEVESNIKEKKGQDVSIDIPMEVAKQTITEDMLKPINGIIASYSTRYSMGDPERAYNVALAAEKIDGQLLMPGEEVSFQNKIGEISTENGFKAAKIIVNNEYVDGTGGGVCQVSSTLYNALLLGGIQITSRTNHSFPSAYVPIGRDATIATPGPDLKYKNTNPFPVFIKSYAGSGVMTSVVYGDTTRMKKVEIFSEETSSTDAPIQYTDDPTLPKGKEVVDDPGHRGYTSVTYKIVDGQKSVLSRDTYRSTPRKIRRGTGPEINEENKEDSENSNTQIQPPPQNPSQPAQNPPQVEQPKPQNENHQEIQSIIF